MQIVQLVLLEENSNTTNVKVKCNNGNGTRNRQPIQIQPMLRLNGIFRNDALRGRVNSNTTNVKVKYCISTFVFTFPYRFKYNQC